MSIESVQPWATRPRGKCMGTRSALVVVGYSMRRGGALWSERVWDTLTVTLPAVMSE